MKYRLTEPAERDVRNILRETLQLFGPIQVTAYAAIIERGMLMVAEKPDRPGTVDRGELAPGVRSLHLEFAARRRGGAAHCLYYLRTPLSDPTEGIVIVRVLHERMEPRYRVLRSLSDVSDLSSRPDST
jgi:toxin ParE1/3/4